MAKKQHKIGFNLPEKVNRQASRQSQRLQMAKKQHKIGDNQPAK